MVLSLLQRGTETWQHRCLDKYQARRKSVQVALHNGEGICESLSAVPFAMSLHPCSMNLLRVALSVFEFAVLLPHTDWLFDRHIGATQASVFDTSTGVVDASHILYFICRSMFMLGGFKTIASGSLQWSCFLFACRSDPGSHSRVTGQSPADANSASLERRCLQGLGQNSKWLANGGQMVI